MQRIRKAVTVMEKANKEYLINIFKELTTDLPQDLITVGDDGGALVRPDR